MNEMSQNEIVAFTLKTGIKYSFPDSNIPENSLVIGFSVINAEQIEKAFNLLI